ncbi:MAG: hypothetical protein A3H41_03875 [Omnitrophica WOR_2 bacterium RIFCSPLOWO2_02_FULL_45_28]|nr:MAG: hypothetical protein A3H41_03875 [Omnitrophica WOR_2 bacterium RIFCSPLOWO2_02_FULL_45_28]
MILLALMVSGLSLWLKTSLCKFTSNSVLLNGLYISALSLIFYILEFPLEFYEGYLLERRFKLSNQAAAGYLKDNFKRAGISFVIASVAAQFLYLFLGKFTRIWWILASLGWFFLTVILAKITPSIFIPLFYKYLPLKDAELRRKIMALFSSASAALKDVHMIDFSCKTKKLNAAVVGFGSSRRVILADNLLQELSHNEILSIVAHELGHYKNRDTIKIILFSASITTILFFVSDIILKRSFMFFGYSGISDIAGFPLFALIMLILGMFVLPLQNGFIRHLETRADFFSLSQTQSPDSFISMMEKLSQKNLADVHPGRFVEIMLYTHPPIAKRIKLAEEFKQKISKF